MIAPLIPMIILPTIKPPYVSRTNKRSHVPPFCQDLQEVARTWYHNLLHDSIEEFDKL